jgi:SAM-dependent methyltransferase
MGLSDFSTTVKQTVAGRFDRSIEPYQAFENKYRLFESLAAALADSIDLQPNSRVLDVGCGYGISSRVLQERYACHVTGVDLSAKMIEAGRRFCKYGSIRLLVGDGERLEAVVGGQAFDYVLYNASIFILPDAHRSIKAAVGCLRPGGKIAFSFYPQLRGPGHPDLITEAFRRLKIPPPRYRVITSYDNACASLGRLCGPVSHFSWQRPLTTSFLKDFFAIPAQSASLFPKLDEERRRTSVARLFDTLEDVADTSWIVWPMAASTKPMEFPVS